MLKSKAFSAALSLALLFTACAPTTKPASQDDTIAIAVVGPMSGDLAVFGAEMRRGAELAVTEINAKGGVLGRKLRLVVRDDGCKPPVAEQVARELVTQGVDFVEGHFCSGSSIPASKIYGAAGILQITPASTNPALTNGGISTVMRISGRDDRQGDTVADWLIAHYSGKPVALIDDSLDYGREVIAVVEKRLQGSAVQVVVRQSFPYELGDFTALARKLTQARVEAVYIGGFHAPTAALVKALRAAGSTAEIAASDALNTAEFWELAGPAAEGVRYTDGPVLALTPPLNPDPDRFDAAGSTPTGYAWTSYATIEAFAAAAEAVGSTKGPALADWLKANRVETVLGGLEWDRTGDIRGISYRWYIWRNGSAYLKE